MIRRMFVGFLLLGLVCCGVDSGRAQGTGSAQSAATVSPASARRILTKNAEYLKLLSPPQGEDYLRAYSQGYRDKATEIDAKIAFINDEKVRNQAREAEWAQVTKREMDRFKYEADVAFNEARTSFSRAHREAWFEVGRGTYDDNSHSYVVRPTSTAPVEMPFQAAMAPATLDQIHAKFRQIVSREIDQKAHDYVAKSGADSNCSRNSDWCYQFEKEEIEKALQSERIVVVAQGDLEKRKIDRLLIVDYDTEAILLELDPHVPILNGVAWRFSMGEVPPLPVEPEPVVVQAPPPAASSIEPKPSPKLPANDAAKGPAGEPASSAPIAPTAASAPAAPAARTTIPASVVAASILTRVQPEYPPEARVKQIHGDVVLRATIDKEGKISDVHVLSGDDVLAQAAVEAVRQWRYKPIVSEGEAIEVETTITISFSLLE